MSNSVSSSSKISSYHQHPSLKAMKCHRYKILPPIPYGASHPQYHTDSGPYPLIQSTGTPRGIVQQSCYGVDIEPPHSTYDIESHNHSGKNNDIVRERPSHSHYRHSASPGGRGTRRARVVQTCYGTQISHSHTHFSKLDPGNTRQGQPRSGFKKNRMQSISNDAGVYQQQAVSLVASSSRSYTSPRSITKRSSHSVSVNNPLKHLSASAFVPNVHLPPIIVHPLETLQQGRSTYNSRHPREGYVKTPVIVIRTDQAVNRTPSTEMAYYNYMDSLYNDSRIALTPIAHGGQSISSNATSGDFHSFQDNISHSKTSSVKSRTSTPGVTQQTSRNDSSSSNKETVNTDVNLNYELASTPSSGGSWDKLERDGMVSKKTRRLQADKRRQKRVTWHIQEPQEAEEQSRRMMSRHGRRTAKSPNTRLSRHDRRGTADHQHTLHYGTFVKPKPPLLESILNQIQEFLGKFKSRFRYIVHYPNNINRVMTSSDQPEEGTNDRVVKRPVIKSRRSTPAMHPFSSAHWEQRLMDMTMNTAARYQMELDKRQERKTSQNALPLQAQSRHGSMPSDAEPSGITNPVPLIPTKTKATFQTSRLPSCMTCDTENSFKRLTNMRREVGLLDIETEECRKFEDKFKTSRMKQSKTASLENKQTTQTEESPPSKTKTITKKVKKPIMTDQVRASQKQRRRSKRSKKLKRKAKRVKKSIPTPNTAVELLDQWFPLSMRAKSKSILPSWYPESMRSKISERKLSTMEMGKKDMKMCTKNLMKDNSSSQDQGVFHNSGLMQMVQHIDAEFRAATVKKSKCPVQWSDMLKNNYPCPTLDEWPAWWTLKEGIAKTTKSLKTSTNRLLQKQEEMRREYRLQTVQQMHALDMQRQANDKNAIHPWIASRQGKQDRRLQYWLHERTLGKDPYLGCVACRMQGYEMNLRDNKPHLVLHPGLHNNDEALKQ